MQRYLTYGRCALWLLAPQIAAAAPGSPSPAKPLEFGVDRSNMGVQWMLAWPHEPKAPPFLAADYNKPGNFEARRVAVMNGIARVHAGWFRDGLGSSIQAIDLLKLVHARGMKMLAIIGPAASDFPPGTQLSKAQSGGSWGTYPLSKINLAAFQQRVETKLAAVHAAGETVDAFEIGNELDLYAGSSWWTNQPWYFQYDALGQPGGDLNKADALGVYKAMDRAGAIRAFNQDVVERLRSSAAGPVNIRHVFYYAYDSGAPSPKCDHVKYSWPTKLQPGFCIDGMIDPSTGDLLPGIAAAVAGDPSQPGAVQP